jgi:hypothetical protein
MPPGPSDAAPVWLIVAAGPEVPGVDACLAEAERSARAGAGARVLFTEDGLACLAGEWPARLAAAGAATTLCTRSARARRVAPESVPASVPWSSLTTFLASVPDGARLWTAFP